MKMTVLVTRNDGMTSIFKNVVDLQHYKSLGEFCIWIQDDFEYITFKKDDILGIDIRFGD